MLAFGVATQANICDNRDMTATALTKELQELPSQERGATIGAALGAIYPETKMSCQAQVSASPEALALAVGLVRKFPECFWFWHPEATIRSGDDIRLVIEHLREYGDKRAWAAARDLKRCL